MATIITFPTKQEPAAALPEVDPSFEAAKAEIENRFGVSLWDFLGFTGDKEQTEKKMERALAKETMKYRTDLISDK